MSDPAELPPLRTITKIYIASLATAAAGTAVALLSTADWPSGSRLAVAVGLTAAVVLAYAVPIYGGHQLFFTIEVVPLVAATLLFDPGIAMLIAAVGIALAHPVRAQVPWLPPPLRRMSWTETTFNGSSLALQAAAMGLTIAAIGWHPGAPSFDSLLPIVAVLVGGTAMYVVERLSFAGVISFEEGRPLATVFYDSTLGGEPAEHLQHVAQLGVGLLAAVVADSHPWALALLLLPTAAVYLALQQHVAMRRRAEANLAAAQRVADLGSLDWDLSKDNQQWSDALFAIFGLDPRATPPTTASYLSVVHPDETSFVEQTLARAHEGDFYAIDHRIVRPDGAERVVHSRGEVVRGRGGEPRRVVGTVHDVTERKHLEAQLEHQAFHDPLTDLPNRALFIRRLDEALDAADGEPPHIAVLFLDLDRFKLINDTLGHEAGDQLLIATAARLRSSIRLPGDIVARLGGDEFTILLDDVRDDAEAEFVARRIIEAVTVPVILSESREMVVSTSIGIVRPGPDHRTGAELLRDADNALYRAKEEGRNRFAFFDASMGAETAERVALETDLRRALDRGELRVLYQPKIELATERPVAVEVFLRWHHPERGTISPTRFIPIAEETGLIGPIGSWVLTTACREATTWDTATGRPPVLSVNLSGKQLHDPDFPRHLADILRDTGLPPRRLRLEIGETAAMKNAEATIQALSRLQQIGVRAVIDDFGTGSASLGSLRRFPVDTLQLDHSFVAELGRSRDATTIARAVVGLAHGLGLTVVAEGVERPDQLAQLRALGCAQAQGNLFAPPLEVTDLHTYLARPSATAVTLTPSPQPVPQL
jgi:diguanylate cyclase (GGDEF)-like protein/PAS domain S-box-containing protein